MDNREPRTQTGETQALSDPGETQVPRDPDEKQALTIPGETQAGIYPAFEDRESEARESVSRRSAGEDDVLNFVSGITGSALLRIEENLPHGFVRLKVAEAERRQAQHDIRTVEDIVTELVRNSRDAGATRVLVGFQKEQGRFRRITVLDNGSGIPQDMHGLVFEPRVTSKRDDFEVDRYGVHGRGMALFSIRSRAQGAEIVSSMPGLGTVISVKVDTDKVPERSDQGTMPRLTPVDGGHQLGQGPHNVARVLLEMSIDNPGTAFFLGSFAEVLATARDLAGKEDESIWSRASTAGDARELSGGAGKMLGLPVSERNAYRVLSGEISRLQAVNELPGYAEGETESALLAAGRVEDGREARQGRTKTPARNPVRMISDEDIEEMERGTSEVVERILSSYYLRKTGTRVKKGRGKITISFFLDNNDEEDRP